MDFPEECFLYQHDRRLEHYAPTRLRALKATLVSGGGEIRKHCLEIIIAYIEKFDHVDPAPFIKYLFDHHGHFECECIAKTNLYNAALFAGRLKVVDWLTSHFMKTHDQHHAVRIIAKSQITESARMFLEAMMRLDSKPSVLITELLTLTVQSASSKIQTTQDTQIGQVECETLAIDKLEILFTHSKTSFGWPDGLINKVENLEKLPLYLEDKFLKLLALRQCYPIRSENMI